MREFEGLGVPAPARCPKGYKNGYIYFKICVAFRGSWRELEGLGDPARCPKGYKNGFPDIFSSQATQEASQRVFKALQVPLGAKILDFEGQLGSQDPPKIEIFELPRRILTQYMQKCENLIPAPTGTTFLFPRGCPKPSKNLSKINLKSLLC